MYNINYYIIGIKIPQSVDINLVEQTINFPDSKRKLTQINLRTDYNVDFFDDNNKISLEYNEKVERWMLWHKPNGSSSNLKIWMVCQGKKGDLFDKQVYFSLNIII